MKLRSILCLSAAVLFAISCHPKEEEKPEIFIPSESQSIFTSGMSFESGDEASAQVLSKVVTFTATANWSTSVTETTKAPGWLSLNPSRGIAGLINMTVTVQPNSAYSPRSATVMITCGSVSVSFTVTQNGAIQPVIPVSSVTLDKTTLELTAGSTATLTATVSPGNATDKTVTWTSNNASVATVNDGVVTAVSAGAASITATAGGKTASCTVIVKDAVIEVTSVTLDRTSLSLEEGQTATLVATVSPEDATDKTVTWSSSDPSVAIVADGIVAAVAEGTVTITATAGDKTATCSVTVTKKDIAVTSVTLNKNSIELAKGESETLVATVLPENATDKTVTWTTSDATVATVDQTGKVTAVGGGSATITAKAGDKQAACTVTVNVPVESITLDQTSMTLEEGKTAALTATVNPEDATDKTVTWNSSNTAVATVNNGVVTAVAEGSATITASAGDKSATCTVVVKKQVIEVTSVTLNKSSLSLTKGQTETLRATVAPNNATDKTVTWSSNSPDVATVNQNGQVTAVGGGSAVIKAKAGNKEATCVVLVSVPVESISLDITSITLEEGQSITLTATVTPDDANDKDVTWISSKPSVARVDDGLVTALREGTTTITATAGGMSVTCTVKVRTHVIAVTSVTLNKSTLDLTKGSSETLVATVTPDNATDRAVSWSSSNTSVATVDRNGKVTAVGGGNATITARAGSKEATCEVAVTVPVTSVILDRTSVTLAEGQTTTLVATVNPSDATDKTVTWSSSDAAVATVDNGQVTALSNGTATITVTAGGKTATCTVSVVAYAFGITPASVEVSGDGESFSITVVCTGEYSLTSKPDWINQQSVNDKVHTFRAERNPSETERSGVITFTDMRGDSLSCAVTQSGHSPDTEGGSEDVIDGDDINW